MQLLFYLFAYWRRNVLLTRQHKMRYDIRKIFADVLLSGLIKMGASPPSGFCTLLLNRYHKMCTVAKLGYFSIYVRLVVEVSMDLKLLLLWYYIIS